MARNPKPVVQLITVSRLKPRPEDRRAAWQSRAATRKALLLFVLVAILTVAQLVAGGRLSFLT